MLRSHSCGELSESDIDKKVCLCGWVNSRRDHGKIIFIDIRDRYGITQLVFIPSVSKETCKLAEKLKNEDVILVKGKVSLRPKGTVNLRITTGSVEIAVEELDILNKAKDIPFLIEDSIDASEEVRLSYRFLDLRRKPLLDNLTFRYRVIKTMRGYLDKKDFLEIETPFLTKSTPEGARDFLVPSRLNPAMFYALPQSPQLFKQLLMISGVDRYYQVARCFRDEDLRKDRQPEFTQLDLEMSFVNEEDIYSLVENMVSAVFKEVIGKDLPIPFKRISYTEAMDKFSTDKPDLKDDNPFRFVWVTSFPLFKFNEEEKRWESEHHPFTAPDIDDLSLLESGLAKVKSRSYDLVLNGEEIGSGSIRIHSPEMQEKIFSIIGIDKDEAEKKFGFLVKALRYGAPPHGGFALGLDRLVSLLRNTRSIREVIAFPKTQKGLCPLTGAPSLVYPGQLDELSLKVNIPEGKTEGK